MQITETIGVSLPNSVEARLPEDIVVLVDRAGIALGVRQTFSARVLDVSNDGSSAIASRCVEIPLVGPDGEVSGVLWHTGPSCETGGAVDACANERVRAIAQAAQFIVHDIKDILAMIGSGLRLLERESDAEGRKAIVGKMQETIARGALLTRQLLDAGGPRLAPIDGFVAGSRLTAFAGALDHALRTDVAVRTEIAPDLWDFHADPEGLFLALLNLCRNSADAMPDGGTIIVAARNGDHVAGAVQRYVEIIVVDEGEGMSEEVLSQALTPYFTTKPAANGSGLGLHQVQRFAEGRDGAVRIQSARGVGTVVRLFLPSVQASELTTSIVGPEIAFTPSPDGGVFHIVNPARTALTL